MHCFQSFKGRKVSPNQRVRVYRNIHKPGVVYSIQDPKTGLVLGHTEALLLANASFKVSDAGRERVRRTGSKNVHAFVEGTLTDDLFFIEYMQMVKVLEKVMYNPYMYKSFVAQENETPVTHSSLVLINCHGVQAFQPA